MQSPKQVTAIFDIGKTNKKFLLFDDNYAVVEKHQTKLEQTLDDDGDPCEDLEKLESWIRNQFRAAQEKFRIHSLNFSAYGASLVHINGKGEPVTPLYNYLKSYPEDLLHQFYKSVGGKKQFSVITASPLMGMLNSGLQLFWLKYEKPELFKQIRDSLHFPNYLSYLFTNKRYSELTSIGCHTGMWNFKNMEYHHWLKDEGIQHLLPEPQPVSKILKTDGFKTGPGIHDSTAALAPYLMSMKEPFLLISTGTWSISLNAFNNDPLTYEELNKDCLCYFDIFGRQVKASRFFLGAEYSHQKKRMDDFFEKPINEYKIQLNTDLMNQLVQKSNSDYRLELERAHNSGPVSQKKPGHWSLNNFSSYIEAYHQLMLDLAALQVESIKLALGSVEIENFIVTGGFAQNNFFLSLLASFFPDTHIYTSRLSDASALGAAMVINENNGIANEMKRTHSGSQESHLGMASQARNDMKELLGLKLVKPIKGLHLNNYSWV